MPKQAEQVLDTKRARVLSVDDYYALVRMENTIELHVVCRLLPRNTKVGDTLILRWTRDKQYRLYLRCTKARKPLEV